MTKPSEKLVEAIKMEMWNNRKKEKNSLLDSITFGFFYDSCDKYARLIAGILYDLDPNELCEVKKDHDYHDNLKVVWKEEA